MTPEQKDHRASGPLAEVLKPRQTLWDISSEIAELLELRESAETDEVRANAEQALEAYREQLPQKVDDTRGWIKHCQMMAECARREAKEQSERAQIWERKADHAKAYVLETMLAFGTKKLSGRTGELRVFASPPAVEVTREDILPNELKRVTITFHAGLWYDFVAFIDRYWSVVEAIAKPFADKWRMLGSLKIEIVPDKAALAAALKAPCRQCSGTGEITDLPEGGTFITDPCPDCAGSGKVSVPGARLTQGSHLRL